jgi:hypothetical protein
MSTSDKGMAEFYDLIALPKRQSPGGPIQASDGRWYLMIPADIELADAVALMERFRAGRPVTPTEKKALRDRLKTPGDGRRGELWCGRLWRGVGGL